MLMSNHVGRFAYSSRLIAGAVAILIGTTGIAATVVWLNASLSSPTEIALQDNRALSENAHKKLEGVGDMLHARPRCPGCGVIVSMREVDVPVETSVHEVIGAVQVGNPDEAARVLTRNHEITIRMADGSSRVISHASPANWRLGERVVVIDANPPVR